MRGFIFSFGAGFLFCLKLQAAPFPGMASSVLVNPEYGIFLASQEFRLNTKGTPWRVATSFETDNSVALRLLLDRPTGQLSLKIESLAPGLKLEAYAKKWVKEYAQFGFEILGSQNLNLQGHEVLVMDLIQKNRDSTQEQKQLRQVIIHSPKRVAIFTCNDLKENFLATLPLCNSVVKSFSWADQGLRM